MLTQVGVSANFFSPCTKYTYYVYNQQCTFYGWVWKLRVWLLIVQCYKKWQMLISNAVNAKDFRSNLGDLQNIAVKVKETGIGPLKRTFN